MSSSIYFTELWQEENPDSVVQEGVRDYLERQQAGERVSEEDYPVGNSGKAAGLSEISFHMEVPRVIRLSWQAQPRRTV